MQFDKDILEFHYNNILNGFCPFVFDGEPLLGKFITPYDMFETSSHVLSMKEIFKEHGLLSEYDILQECKERGLWSYNQEREIVLLKDKIKKRQESTVNLILPSQIKQIENEIKRLNQELLEKESIKSNLLTNSIEQKTILEKRDYIAYNCIYKTINAKRWKSYEEFLNEDTFYINTIIPKYYKAINELTTPIMRAISRTYDARIRFKNCFIPEAKNCSVVFLELKQWCEFYNSIYELEDKPHESIIVDDDKLDGWVSSRKAQNSTGKSVNNKEGFTAIMDSTKEDMEVLGGISREQALKIAVAQNG
jgi:hypothetical protein